MLKKKWSPKTPPKQSIVEMPGNPKYQHPKILTIDTDPKVSDVLIKEGYNVSVGTFGKPYKVPKSSNYNPVVVDASLPNYTEQEIIIVDLIPGTLNSRSPAEKMVPNEELDWWAKCNFGQIDPRPRAMVIVQDSFDRILANGGAFVVFSDSRHSQELVLARYYANRYQGFSVDQKIPDDNWSFLSILSNLTITSDDGEEIQASREGGSLVKLLADHLDDASFRCTFRPEWHIKQRWTTIAQNKYGAAVGGIVSPPEGTKSGWIFILPQIRNKAVFLSAFLKSILPDLCPRLFPHAEGQNWVHRAEYELPSVLAKAQQISNIQDESAQKIAALEKAILADRNANQFLYALIRETGDSLVEAVKEALSILGFKSVVDVDKEMARAGKDGSLREDLRIHDKSPVLIVDIKGVAGTPADAEALQSQKHAFIYIQEQKCANVRGLTIINHQRLLPPLERENNMPFRNEILLNAEQLNLGLLTGWDLFRLVRGFIQNKWIPDQVTPLFYQIGRIFPIPIHYAYIGKIKQIWKSAFSVEIERDEIRVGERIAIEFPVDFDEQDVISLWINNESVNIASANCEVGIQRRESLPRVRCGMPVYRISSQLTAREKCVG